MAAFILTLTCPDQPGIVHAVSAGLLADGGNIIENAQFSEPLTNTFCIRTVLTVPSDDVAAVRAAISGELDNIGVDSASLKLRPLNQRPRVLIMVSKYDHCLVDLLYRWRNGGLDIEIPIVVSNHPDLRATVEHYGIEFRHLPVTGDTKHEQEIQVKQIVDDYRVDLVVLARYMQILSNDLCDYLHARAINIHHSFLPGFKGARPYHQAHDRGVKIIGATAHYVTAELDEGPIIDQDVARVDHTYTPETLVRLGQDIERIVLSRAVKAWSEDRVLLVGHRTVIF